ncbi:carbon storage regulator [Campylobacter sp. MIT 99-7217]|uniref:carbon storage regulator n=1 Tax=Campylobacter sp. MIT 99-7217 TaxID=535091 RepID=UPI00115C2884|nr:carbon storage regulator [Campylobacter sp. MIT 99-7217]TQR29338.1 carbon storage regulator [Campylobacter sp. MIT 99-7217]
MLVLTRKDGESIQIGEDVEIKIISSTKGVSKVAIKAPKSLMILRKELLNQIKDENLHSIASKSVKLDDLSKKIKK